MNRKSTGLIAFLLLLFLLSGILFSCGEKQKDVPQPALRNLLWAVGAPLPAASDFAVALPVGYSLRFAEDYVFDHLGDYAISLIQTDSGGKETTRTVKLTLTVDSEPPVISGVCDRSVTLGEGVAYRSGVSVTDNCDSPVTLTVDSSAVDLNTAGSYPVFYRAKDGAGNTAEEEAYVHVYRAIITEEMLNRELDRVIASIITDGMNREEKARAVYAYVYGNISYQSTSDKSSWVNAAYTALFVSGGGDCFSYFAASKAFFRRLGIETMDIQRKTNLVTERHYWNLVNIGENDGEKLWYHFDACHLQGVQHSGCLLTDRQIASYNRTRVADDGVTTGYFYAYDVSAYPVSATKIITETPSLEPYDY